MATQKDIYNKFMEEYGDYPKKLFALIDSVKKDLPETEEDENYNAGCMQKDADIGLSSNVAVINAYSFEKAFDDYRQRKSDMPETEIKARVVFDFLSQHGVDFSYERNKNDFLFKDEQGKDVTREMFYANSIYKNALCNTNFFDRNVGNVQLLCLEPKSMTDMPRNIQGLSDQSVDRFMRIPDEERLRILYKRGMYHESIHIAMGTTDERKCDAFALLKVMKEHPKYAKTVFDVYNMQRSKMGYTVSTLHKKEGAGKQRAIKGGAMTYLMPNTYKKLEEYALNPEKIPDNDADVLKLACALTAKPEFSKKQLVEYAKLVAKDYVTPRDLGNNEIVRSCMRQGGFKNIQRYIESDKKLNDFISKHRAEKGKSIPVKISSLKKLEAVLKGFPETKKTKTDFNAFLYKRKNKGR